MVELEPDPQSRGNQSSLAGTNDEPYPHAAGLSPLLQRERKTCAEICDGQRFARLRVNHAAPIRVEPVGKLAQTR